MAQTMSVWISKQGSQGPCSVSVCLSFSLSREVLRGANYCLNFVSPALSGRRRRHLRRPWWRGAGGEVASAGLAGPGGGDLGRRPTALRGSCYHRPPHGVAAERCPPHGLYASASPRCPGRSPAQPKQPGKSLSCWAGTGRKAEGLGAEGPLLDPRSSRDSGLLLPG